MAIRAGWVDPPPAIGGLDHIGTQAPCILIYSQLMPGITNVTDRARYYSFYPWLIWSFDHYIPRTQAATRAEFIELYRRADCLFTLIAERHSVQTDRDPERHGAAMVGRNKLVPALERLGDEEELNLADFVASESDKRYFKNEMGGLGQYYAGVLYELKILETQSKGWPRLIDPRGSAIARSFDASVPGSRFWAVCQSGRISPRTLDELSGFCPCHLAADSPERESLHALFWGEGPYADEAAAQRRLSLFLLLHLTKTLSTAAKPVDLTQAEFRGCIHAGTLPDGSRWSIPDVLTETRRRWSIYQRGDLLSVAFQGLLTAGLQQMTESSRYRTVQAFVGDFVAQGWVHGVIAGLPGPSVGEATAYFRENGPRLEEWLHRDHEVQLVEQLSRAGADVAVQADRLRASLLCLIALMVRNQDHPLPLEAIGLREEVLTDYPINLTSFNRRARTWASCSLKDLFAHCMEWVLTTHLHVALRKLRQTGQSSFRFQPGEMGFEVNDVPPPTHTVPRFRQSMQILRDSGFIERDPTGICRVTPVGLRQLEALDG